MANSSSRQVPLKNVPPPTGARSAAGGNAYTRFIPREELQGFASWRPGSFAADGAEHTPQADAPLWQARLAQARQAAAQEGYQNGYRDGLVALEAFKQSFAAQTTAQIGHLLHRLDAELGAMESEMAAALANAAVALARQVLKSELLANPAVVSSVAAQAVQAVLLSARNITVRVHPLDLPLVQQGAAEALAARGARAVADASIERGGCIVQTDVGTVDARISARWAQASAGLGASADWNGETINNAP